MKILANCIFGGVIIFTVMPVFSILYAENVFPPLSGVVVFPHAGQAGGYAPIRDYVGPNRLASDDPEHQSQNECAIFIDPSDPSHIIGGSNDYRTGGAWCGWFVSFDQGESWESGLVDGLDLFGFSGDPSVVIDRGGIAFIGGINFNRDDPRRGGIFVSRSEDGGLNWEDPSWVIVHEDDDDPPFEDKPFLGIDNTDGEHDGNIYISWTRFGTGQIHFSRSTDGAESWSEPLRLTASRGQGSVPSVGPNGEVYVIWKNYSRDQVVGKMSNDGGESFSDLFVVAETSQIPNRLEPTNFRTHSLPSNAVDLSDGDHRGRIYVSWADHRHDDADIMLSFSDDQSENWSEPLRLNDDQVENGLDQFFPWIYVDNITGEMSAIWYDRRRDDDNIMVDVYGVSWNGSDDLPDNVMISSVSFDPRIGFEGAFFGDYIGVAAYEGLKIAVWCDSRSENQDIYSADLDYRRYPPVEGGNEHLMIVESIIIDGEEAEPIDEIAVFDLHNQLIGSALVGEEDVTEFVAAGEWADNRGDRSAYLNWQVWDQSAEEEYIAVPLYLEGDILFRDGGESRLNLIAPPPDNQEIELTSPWNLMSTNLIPHSIDPWELFFPIHDQALIVKNYRGHFLIYEFEFSNLSYFDPLQGYAVKVSEDISLPVNGVQFDAQTPINLAQNWNLIGYPPTYELDPWHGFESILDELNIAKDERGRFLSPPFDFSNMINLSPGEGYQLKTTEEVELIYPEEAELADVNNPFNPPSHFQPVINSPVNMSVLVRSISNLGRVDNYFAGELGAISDEGIVYGALTVDGTPPFGLAVWGDDAKSNFENSLQPGEEFTVIYWDAASDLEYSLQWSSEGGKFSYEPNGFAVVDLEIARIFPEIITEFKLDQVYPNPFNSTAMISFSVPQSSDVEFQLLDISGRSVMKLSSTVPASGTHYIEIDGSDLNSGMYIVNLTVNDQTHRCKLILLR